MSSPALKKSCNQIIADLEASANKQGKTSARRMVNRQKGQILIINRSRFSKTLSALLPQLSGSKNQKHRDAIWEAYDARLKNLENYVKDASNPNRLQDLKDFVRDNQSLLQLRANDHVYYVQSYRSAQRAKGKTLKTIVRNYFDTKKIGYEEDDLRRVSGADNKAGGQIGHAEVVGGQQFGSAVSTIRAAKAKSAVSRFTGAGKTELNDIIGKYETTMNFELDHSQMFDKNGNFRKDYIPVLSWQGSLTNQEQAVLEAAAIEALIQDFKDLANKPGSTTMKHGVAQILLENVAGKKSKNKKVTGKRSKKIKEKGKGSASKKVGITRGVKVARDSTIDKSLAATTATRGRRRQSTTPNIGTLLGILNQRIADTVAKNMEDPRLNYQTGRFASSVEILDINVTPQGFPSVGYTYQKYPYQTFEPGFAQGSQDRDPRKLIDVSIREIAAGMAVGRLYTRRL